MELLLKDRIKLSFQEGILFFFRCMLNMYNIKKATKHIEDRPKVFASPMYPEIVPNINAPRATPTSIDAKYVPFAAPTRSSGEAFTAHACKIGMIVP